MSVNKWVVEENVVHLHNGILLAVKNGIMKISGKWKELEEKKKHPDEGLQRWLSHHSDLREKKVILEWDSKNMLVFSSSSLRSMTMSSRAC